MDAQTSSFAIVYHYRVLILEFKWSDQFRDLSGLPEAAMNQIKERKYPESLKIEGYKTVFGACFGFCAKMCEVTIEEL